MNPDDLRKLLEAVRQGRVSTDDALGRLRNLPFEDLGFAKVDHHRALRTGFPEVIFGPGKTAKQIVAIARRLTLPTLLVRGKLSDLVTQAEVDEFLEMVPHASYVDVADAAHMIAGDRNDVFTDAVVTFLES